MGSIYSYNRNPTSWLIGNIFKLKPELGGERIIELIYGELDDYPQTISLSMFFRESIYNNLLNGEYRVFIRSNGEIIVKDIRGNLIKPLIEGSIY